MIRPRRVARAVTGGLLLGLLVPLFVAASPAWAHAYLVGSDPAGGEIRDGAPEQVVLSFSEPVRLVPDRVLVVGPGGGRVDTGNPRVDGNAVVIPLGQDAGARGTYLVSYRVVSADSHPAVGSLTFSVGAPSATPPVPPSGDADDPAVRAAVAVTRYVGYAGLVLLVGPAVMLALLWPRRLPRRPVVRLLWAGAGLVGASTVVALWLQTPYSTGAAVGETSLADLRDVLYTGYGWAHLVRLGVLAAVAVLLRPVITGRAGRPDRVVLGGLALVGLGTWPVAGHAVSSPLPAVSTVVGVVHLAAVAFWIGGLVVLAGFLLRRADARELGAILPMWSGWAASAVVALLLAGLVLATIEIGTPDGFLTTGYGRLVLAKLGLVAVVIAVAAFSRRLVRQRVAALRPRAVRAAVGLEALLLAAVVAVSSVLVQTTPARTEVAAAQALSRTDFVTTLDSELYALEVVIEPAATGENTVHLYSFTPQGRPLPVEQWRATAALPAEGVEPMQIPLSPISDNHVYGQVTLPLEGEWEFLFTLRVSEVDQTSVSAVVPVG